MWRSLLNKLRQFFLPKWRQRLFLESRARYPQWRKLRAAHLKIEPSCAACGTKKDLDVHHIIPVSVNPQRELDPTNLVTLCSARCHLVFGHFMSYTCYNPDVRQMTKEYRAKFNKRSCLDNL